MDRYESMNYEVNEIMLLTMRMVRQALDTDDLRIFKDIETEELYHLHSACTQIEDFTVRELVARSKDDYKAR